MIIVSIRSSIIIITKIINIINVHINIDIIMTPSCSVLARASMAPRGTLVPEAGGLRAAEGGCVLAKRQLSSFEVPVATWRFPSPL